MFKSIKHYRKPFTFILTICIMFASINLFSLADNENSTDVEASLDTVKEYKMNEAPDVLVNSIKSHLDKSNLNAYTIVETEDLDSITVKHPDGKYSISNFGIPVKYINRTGEIKFIDNSFKELDISESVSDNYDYKNKSNVFDVEYSKNPMNGVRISHNNYEIKMSLFEEPTDIEITAEIKKDSTPSEAEAFKYNNAFGKNTYINYYNTINGIKEDIILEKNINQNKFDFFVNADNTIPVLSEDSTIVNFVDANNMDNVIYVMEPLFAFDSFANSEQDKILIDKSEEKGLESQNTDDEKTYADNHVTYDCHYEIETLETGGYKITIVVSEEWLNHPETVYPVTIDPSIYYYGLQYTAQSTFVTSGSPNKVYSTDVYAKNFLALGGYNGYTYSYLKFPTLPALPTGAIYTQAYLDLRIYAGSVHRYIDVALAAGAWNESTLKYSNQPWPSEMVHGYIAPVGSNFYQATVTTAVRDWYTGTKPNNGFFIMITILQQVQLVQQG